jgi:hypothetical protein
LHDHPIAVHTDAIERIWPGLKKPASFKKNLPADSPEAADG